MSPFTWADGGQVPPTLTPALTLTPWLASRLGARVGPILNWQEIEFTRTLNLPTSVTIQLDMDESIYASATPDLAPRLMLFNGAGTLKFYGESLSESYDEDAASGIAKINFQDPRCAFGNLFMGGGSPGTDSLSWDAGTPFAISDLMLTVFGSCTASTVGGSAPHGVRNIESIMSSATATNTTTLGGTIEPSRSLASAIEEFSETASGMDFDCVPLEGFTFYSGVPSKRWIMGQLASYNSQGSNKPNVRFVFVDNSIDGLPAGLDSNCESMRRSWTKIFNQVNTTGTDRDTGLNAIGRSVDTSDNYPTNSIWQNAPEGKNLAQMVLISADTVNKWKAPLPVFEIINPGLNGPTPLTDYDIGDTVYIYCSRKNMVVWNTPYRVMSYSFKMDSNGNIKSQKITTSPVS